MGCGGAKGVSAPKLQTTALKWGSQGRINLKTIKFKAVYNPASQEVDIDLSSNQVAESTLSWNGTIVSLINTKLVDIETQEEVAAPPLRIEFEVSPEGKFIRLSNEPEYCKIMGESQGYPIITEQQRALILKSGRTEASKLWKMFYESWVNTTLKPAKVESFGKPALRWVSNTASDQKALEDFLMKKYPGEEIDVKAATVEESVVAILEDMTMRPHTIRTRKSRYIVMKSPVRNIIEMTEEVQLYMFCWADVPELGGLTALTEEFNKLNKGISAVLDQFNLSVSALKHI